MTSKIINRYIWLLNQLLMRKTMTFEEIAKNWETSNLNDGKSLAKRTFHDHRKAIKELFGVEIKCNTSTNKYYLSSEESLRNGSIQKWLLSSFTVSNMVEAGHNMKDRIFFEAIPKGTEYIFVDDQAAPQKVILRAHGPSVDYLRSLPLHSSQEEIRTKHEIYSDFQYKIYLTPELETKILAMGENIEVLKPKELRDKIADRLLSAVNRYK